jgi:hypothetical protein
VSKTIPLPNWHAVPNQFTEALPDLSESEIRLTLVLLRYTVGFHQRIFRCSLTRIAKLSGLSRKSILTAAEKLEKRNWFSRIQDGGSTVWAIIIAPEIGRTCPIRGRFEIMDIDNNEIEFHEHHIVPKEFDGTEDKENKTVICLICHKLIHHEIRVAISDGQKPTKQFFKSLLTLNLSVSFPTVPPDVGVSTGETITPPKHKRLPEVTNTVTQLHQTGNLDTPPSFKESFKEKPKDNLISKEQNTWVKVLGQILNEKYSQLGGAEATEYKRFWQPTELHSSSNGVMKILCSGEDPDYQRDWLNDRGNSVVERMLVGILGERMKVEFITSEENEGEQDE